MVSHREDLVSDVDVEQVGRLLSVQPQVRYEHAQPVHAVAVPRRADDAQPDGQDRMAEAVRQQTGHLLSVRLLDLRQHLLELRAQGRATQLRSGDAGQRGTDDDRGPAASQSAIPLQGLGHVLPARFVAGQSRVQVWFRLHRQLVRASVSEARSQPDIRRSQLVVPVQLPAAVSERGPLSD